MPQLIGKQLLAAAWGRRAQVIEAAGKVLRRIGVLCGLLGLALLFYGVVTPLGLLLRWSGRDRMLLRKPPGVTSYWRDDKA